jgi:hypothetical protein
LSGSPTTPVSSAISEFGILKVDAGRNAWPGAIGVAGDDQIIVDLVADEGADRTRVGEPFGKIIADFTALRRDVSESAPRRDCSSGEKAESGATIDQGSTGAIKNSRNDARAIVVKQ